MIKTCGTEDVERDVRMFLRVMLHNVEDKKWLSFTGSTLLEL